MTSGTLYVVATPLGNLEDLSPRSARVLREVDLIACEDTRRTRKLLQHLDIRVPTLSYQEHNEASRANQLIGRLQEGAQVALVSDAGTPLLSDPGYRLVRLCRQTGVAVIPIPGPSAAVAALSVAGLPTDRFLFVGFLPRRPGFRREQLDRLAGIEATLVFYVAPHVLLETLEAVLEAVGNREAFLIREMTKLYESSYPGRLEEIIDCVRREVPQGEYTLVVGPPESRPAEARSRVDAGAYAAGLVWARRLSRKEAIQAASRDLGVPKRTVYRLFTEVDKPRS
jgi:16S rRNA (cytidine1402-2'-O)-methyltransferase